MKVFCSALAMLLGLSLTLTAADPELVGSWIGAIDTDRGQMEIGLEVALTNGKLTGVLKTGHGDWEVLAITEKSGVWTVRFKAGDSEGQMVGRIKEGKFSGDWKSPMATGTFELTRAKKKSS